MSTSTIQLPESQTATHTRQCCQPYKRKMLKRDQNKVENKTANTASHSRIQAPIYTNTQQPNQNGTQMPKVNKCHLQEYMSSLMSDLSNMYWKTYTEHPLGLAPLGMKECMVKPCTIGFVVYMYSIVCMVKSCHHLTLTLHHWTYSV